MNSDFDEGRPSVPAGEPRANQRHQRGKQIAQNQQQAGRIAQLEADLASAGQATDRERGLAEQARQALAKAELRLEALPKAEAETERMRVALETIQGRAIAAEKLAAVTAEKLTGVEARLNDAKETIASHRKPERPK